MDDKVLNQIRIKYVNSTNWLNQKMVEYNFSSAVMLTVGKILRAAQDHTIKTTGCTQEKLDSIFKRPYFQIESVDIHIFKCYCDYLENMH